MYICIYLNNFFLFIGFTKLYADDKKIILPSENENRPFSLQSYVHLSNIPKGIPIALTIILEASTFL